MEDLLHLALAGAFFALTWGLVRLADRLEREARGGRQVMTALHGFALALALLLAAYLLVALFRPERF